MVPVCKDFNSLFHPSIEECSKVGQAVPFELVALDGDEHLLLLHQALVSLGGNGLFVAAQLSDQL